MNRLTCAALCVVAAMFSTLGGGCSAGATTGGDGGGDGSMDGASDSAPAMDGPARDTGPAVDLGDVDAGMPPIDGDVPDTSMPFDGSMMGDGAMVMCTIDADCHPGACMTARCMSGVCMAAARDCADTDPCTVDSCDTATDSCHHAAATDGASCGGAGQLCCAGSCVNTSSDPLSCGMCGHSCGSNANCTTGTCVCLAGFGDCDTMPGCEASLRSDPSHCGTCSMVCSGATPACIAKTCGTCAIDSDCADDGLACTSAPVCATGACTQPLIGGNCLIAGGCYSTGATDPTNPCHVCDPTRNAMDWSPNTGGFCDDGRYCTTTDLCSSIGVCVGTARSCSDGLTCTSDSCDEAGDRCVSTPIGTACAIGGACIPAGTVNPANSCQICDPSADAANWTAQTGNLCDDGLYCTVADSCDSSGACVGFARGCADTVACTADSCNEASDRCDHIVAPGSCQIAGTCYTSGTVNPLNACQSCDPVSSTSAWTARTGQTCDDTLYCTVNDQCTAMATCVGMARTCDDTVSCTVDSCNEATDGCEASPASDKCLIAGVCYDAGTVDSANSCRACTPATNRTDWTARTGALCDDTLFCTVGDACTASSTCVGSSRNCADSLGCTTDSCNEVIDACDHAVTAGNCLVAGACYTAGAANPTNVCQQCTPATSTTAWSPHNGIACDDMLFCTTADTCSGGACTGAARGCDDGISCTADSCDEAGDRCVNTATAGNCTIGGLCYANLAPNPANPCQVCNSAVSTTAWTNLGIGAMCDDNQYCTIGDACTSGGVCMGSARGCSDGLGCTVDSCNEAADQCDHMPSAGTCSISGVCYSTGNTNPVVQCQVCDPSVSATAWTPRTGMACDDLQYCTTADTCTAGAQCVGTPRVCTDGLTCTTDSCAETGGGSGMCVFTTGGSSCSIGGACYAAGQVNPANGCQVCDPTMSSNGWTPRTGQSCNDSLYCTAVDVCTGAGTCVGSGATCDDSVGCTNDSCNEGTDSCTHVPAAGSCFIGSSCYADGFMLNQCQRCQTATSQIAWTPLTGISCNDGLYCTQTDVCNAMGTCAGSGTPCDDMISCTTDTCNELTDSCSHVATAGNCTIGGACYATGAPNPANPSCEWCQPGSSTTSWTARTGNTCNDSNACTSSDVCNAGGVCVGSAITCNDSLACTTDTCNTSTGCVYTLMGGTCLISGACYSNGQLRPSFPCNYCNSASSPLAWSTEPGGMTVECRAVAGTCDRAEYCDGASASCPTDTYLSSGMCNASLGACDPAESCTGGGPNCPANALTPAGTICRAQGLMGPCDEEEMCDGIMPTCPADTGYEGTETPLHVCRAATPMCDVAETCNGPNTVFTCPANGFMASGSACTDGNTTTCESCNGSGACAVTGGPCNDGLSCTTDTCSGSSTCNYTINAGFCNIAGVCYASGAVNPTNFCQRCSPGTSTTAWTAKASGTACGGTPVGSCEDRICCAGSCVSEGPLHCGSCGTVCPMCPVGGIRFCDNSITCDASTYFCDCL